MLASLFADYIIKGKQTLENVPELLKEQVIQILIEQGYEELITN